MYIESARRLVSEHLKESGRLPLGATSSEIDALEHKLNLRFPQAYREFLGWMGRDSKGPLQGSAWFIDCLLANRETLRVLLEEVGSNYVLKETDVVFFAHQGYMAAWFDAATHAPDPSCWFIDDGLVEPRPAGAFSQVLLDDLKGLTSGM
nr:SMI1/KNR4 family protein [uncultured Roseateles sp.]